MKTKSLILLLLVIVFHIHAEETWVNYLGNQCCHPGYYEEPATFEELCQSIKHHASEGHRVRAIGRGYSISDIGCTEGCLLNLKSLNNILSIDPKRKTVRVEAGITIRDLNEQLTLHDLALSNQAAIADLSLGGALSTAVHGTGHTGSFSSFVKEFELVTEDGSLRLISLESDPDTFPAVSVGLGSLGVIYAVTLQCEDLFYLHRQEEVTNIETITGTYQTIHDSTDFFQFFWDVETGRVVTNRWNRSNDLTANLVPAHQALPWYVIDETDKDLFSEIAIPMDSLPEAIQTIRQLATRYQEAGAKIFGINVRFVAQDPHTYLSPSSDQPVAYLTFCLLEEDKYLALYQDFEEAMNTSYNGRPHWGKLNFLDHQKAMNLYGSCLQKFLQVKQRLDPQGIFDNSFTDRLLKDHPGT